jgi:Flp pilus assembly protein TadD
MSRGRTEHARSRNSGGHLSVLAASLLLGACAQIADEPPAAFTTGATPPQARSGPQDQGDLQKSIAHWGQQHATNPRDLNAALNYARALKAAGHKDKALAALQHASIYAGENRELASEYGRLALDMGQVSLAQKLLTVADDPSKPDWRVISAKGTVLAQQGDYKGAIAFYEKASSLAPDEPSVLSNLALAHAAEGHPDEAEKLLRKAARDESSRARVRQNLALVLSLQGKYEEAKQVGSLDLPPDSAAADADYVRRIVGVEPQSVAGPAIAASSRLALRHRPAEAVPGDGRWVTNVARAAEPQR